MDCSIQGNWNAFWLLAVVTYLFFLMQICSARPQEIPRFANGTRHLSKTTGATTALPSQTPIDIPSYPETSSSASAEEIDISEPSTVALSTVSVESSTVSNKAATVSVRPIVTLSHMASVESSKASAEDTTTANPSNETLSSLLATESPNTPSTRPASIIHNATVTSNSTTIEMAYITIPLFPTKAWGIPTAYGSTSTVNRTGHHFVLTAHGTGHYSALTANHPNNYSLLANTTSAPNVLQSLVINGGFIFSTKTDIFQHPQHGGSPSSAQIEETVPNVQPSSSPTTVDRNSIDAIAGILSAVAAWNSALSSTLYSQTPHRGISSSTNLPGPQSSPSSPPKPTSLSSPNTPGQNSQDTGDRPVGSSPAATNSQLSQQSQPAGDNKATTYTPRPTPNVSPAPGNSSPSRNGDPVPVGRPAGPQYGGQQPPTSSNNPPNPTVKSPQQGPRIEPLTPSNPPNHLNSNSQIEVAGQTISAGDPPVTVHGTPVALDPIGTNIVIGGSRPRVSNPNVAPQTITIPTLPIERPPTNTIITSGGRSLTLVPGPSLGAIVIAGQTLQPGESVVISGTPIILPSANHRLPSIVVGSATMAIPQPVPAAIPASMTIIAGQTIATDPRGNIVIDGHTMSAKGATITISGTPISIIPASGMDRPSLFVGGKTIPLPFATFPAPAIPQSGQTITVGSRILTVNSQGNVVVGTKTISLHGPAVTIDGTMVSIIQGASNGPPSLVIGGTTITIPTHAAVTVGTPRPTQDQTLVVGSQTFTSNAQGNVVIAGQALSPQNPAVTLSGTPISLISGLVNAPPSLVVGGSTIAFPTPGGKITAAPQGDIVIAGQTLSPQTSVITVSDTPISLIAGASNATPSLLVDGSTVPIPNAASQAPQTLVLGSQTLTANPDGNFVFGGQTLTPTKGALNFIVNSKTITISLHTSPPVISPLSTLVLNPGTTLTANSKGNFVLPDGQTLTSSNGPATIHGKTISLEGTAKTMKTTKTIKDTTRITTTRNPTPSADGAAAAAPPSSGAKGRIEQLYHSLQAALVLCSFCIVWSWAMT